MALEVTKRFETRTWYIGKLFEEEFFCDLVHDTDKGVFNLYIWCKAYGMRDHVVGVMDKDYDWDGAVDLLIDWKDTEDWEDDARFYLEEIEAIEDYFENKFSE
jgi:hypothetical protein